MDFKKTLESNYLVNAIQEAAEELRLEELRLVFAFIQGLVGRETTETV